jgi:phosphotransferase system, enzyme I, PtsP
VAGTPDRHLSLLERITEAITHSHDLPGTLANVVALVKEEMHTAVCSLYLYDEEKDRLVLAATRGLQEGSIGKVEMKPAEGLTGLVFTSGEPQVVKDASRHPRYKYFPITGEEEFHSFLGVPLISRHRPIGVLVVQDRETRAYSRSEVQLFTTIAGQVAGVVVNARLLAEVSQAKGDRRAVPRPALSRPRILHGIPATPGIAMGKAHILETADDLHFLVEERAKDPARERSAFAESLAAARVQVEDLQTRMARQVGEDNASIFNIHLMMLEDQGFSGKVLALVDQGFTALFAVKTVISDYLRSFETIADPYLRDRSVDVEDVGRRLIRNLTGSSEGRLAFEEEGVLVAGTLTPSDAANLPAEMVKGIVTTSGGQTSHAIILARSLGIPCVVGAEDLLEVVRPGDFLILDGNTGNVYLNPDREVVREYRRHMDDFARHLSVLVSEKDLPSVTADGCRISLLANAGLLSDLRLIHFYGAEGVGLYRTEFPYFARKGLPSEEEQYRIYRKMVEGAEGKPVTIRTLDAGGDKELAALGIPPEENPFLGWRAIRLCLGRMDIFTDQLRAIYRAANHGPVKLLIPMVSSLEEVLRVKAVLAETLSELAAARIPHNPEVPLGVMIEIPAAALIAPRLAREVDFFSIGTNDLTQYALAVDRNNKKVAHLFNPMNPGVIQLMALTARAAGEAGIPVSVCGEVASDPAWAPLLVGMGFTELSMNPASIPLVRRAVRALSREEAARAARKALKAGTVADVQKLLAKFPPPQA